MKALSLIAGVLVIGSLAASLTSCDLGLSNSPDDTLAHFTSGCALPGSDLHSLAISYGGIVYFLVSESDQGNTDLNGDGDPADNVVHCLDPDTGVKINLGVSVRLPLATTASRIVWAASEIDEGGTDLNGDGDIADQVLVSYDPTVAVGLGNPLITTISAALNTPLLTWGDLVVFATSEADVGVSLNGDVDLEDIVVRVFNATTGAVVLNTSLALDPSTGSFVVGNGFAAFLVSEFDQNDTDLNGDGDTGDTVVYGVNLGLLSVFPVGGIPATPRACNNFLPGIFGTPAAPVIPYFINEGMEGNLSFNGNGLVGDTDTNDDVLALFDVTTATETLPFTGLAVDPSQIAGNATRCVFVAPEGDNSGTAVTDFNTDGDESDEVPFWLDLALPGTAFSLGVAATPGFAVLELCDEYIVFSGSETNQGPLGTNHNAASGDADVTDDVAFYTDISAVGIPTVNSGWAINDIACLSGRFFLFVPEAAQNDTDLAGDGDTDDVVLVFFLAMGPTITRGPDIIVTDGNLVIQACPTVIRIYANLSEANGFGDLNLDGDETDFILTVSRLNALTGTFFRTTPVATCDTDGSAFPMVVDGDTVIFPFAEQMVFTGLNVNGDLDAADIILDYVNTICF